MAYTPAERGELRDRERARLRVAEVRPGEAGEEVVADELEGGPHEREVQRRAASRAARAARRRSPNAAAQCTAM